VNAIGPESKVVVRGTAVSIRMGGIEGSVGQIPARNTEAKTSNVAVTTHLGSPPLKMEQPGELHARLEDGVPSIHDQPVKRAPDVGGLLAARYVSTSDAGIGEGSGVTMRQAVDSRSDPVAGDMSVVCEGEAEFGEKRRPLNRVHMWPRERHRESNVALQPLPAHQRSHLLCADQVAVGVVGRCACTRS
jgi:hypothetical protein